MGKIDLSKARYSQVKYFVAQEINGVVKFLYVGQTCWVWQNEPLHATPFDTLTEANSIRSQPPFESDELREVVTVTIALDNI